MNYWLKRVSSPKTYQDGTIIWKRKNGSKHRNGDDPACEFCDGAKHWYKNGKLHRDSGPACVYPDGSTEWYHQGYRHRGNGDPACEYADGVKEWWEDGARVRTSA